MRNVTKRAWVLAGFSLVVGVQADAQVLNWLGLGGQSQAQQQEQAAAPVDVGVDPSKSDDPAVFCQGFDRVEVVVDGRKAPRFQVPDPKYLRCLPPQPEAPWVVTKDRWAQADELNWQNFVRSLGQSSCNTLDTCLASSSNPYRDENDVNAFHYSDCADFPMYMRAYFSYKNSLPFSMVAGFETNPLSDEQQEKIEKRKLQEEAKGQLDSYLKTLADNRYSVNGNRPMNRYNVPHSGGAARDFFKAMDTLHDAISSGTYRMFMAEGDVQSDFYSPMISKESIRPGTVLYKVTGHVALVYDVTADGEVKYIDAHPDNSITRGSFSKEYMRSNPFQGGGFKNWRPFYMVDKKKGPAGEELPAQKDRDGVIRSGRMVYLKDAQISDFSAEQYYGNQPSADWNWQNGKFVVGGREVGYYDYIRIRLANGVFKLSPTFQFRKDLGALCGDLQERSRSVQVAIDSAVHEKEHPINLPLNIYGAEGEWESFSTPGRDLRIRKRALDMIDNAKEYMAKWMAKDPYFEYQGRNLKAELIKIYHEVDSSCRIGYKNSQGQEVRMGLTTALNRITSLSFDPYFCPERRWGARSEAELRSCVESADKAEWYEFTQFLRNAVVRDPTEVMGYSLNDVKRITAVQAADAKEQSSRFNILRGLHGL